jgi:hypothetical protein
MSHLCFLLVISQALRSTPKTRLICLESLTEADEAGPVE